MNNENQTEQASVSVGRDVKDGVAVAGHDNITNVTMNITQSPEKPDAPKPDDSRFLFPNYIIVLALIGLSVWWWFSIQNKLKPFEEKIYGIIVTQFKGNTDARKNKGKEIQSAIQSTLNARFKELGINDADARNTSVLLESHEAAREFGKKYKAELVIWGDVTLQGIIPNITIVNEESDASKLMKPETALLKDSLTHIALAKVNDIRFPALTDEPTKLVSFITAIKYKEQKKYEKAIEYFTYSLSEQSDKYIDSSAIIFFRGNVHFYMKQYDESIDDYTQAISLDTKYDAAYNNRGVAYSDKGEYDKAIIDYSQAISLNLKYDAAYNNRGNAYSKRGEYNKAIEDYSQAISLNPKYDAAYNNRGEAYRNKGEYEKAIADYSQAISINPKNAGAYNSISWLLATCPDDKYRDGNKAIEFTKKILELEPDNSAILDTLAAAYAEAEKFEDAVKTQEKAIEMLTEKDKDEYLSSFMEHLNFYKAKKPWREKPKSGK